MKIGIFVQSSSQEVYAVDTEILLDYYRKVIDKNNLGIDVFSYQGNNDSSSYSFLKENRLFLPADERDTSMVMTELLRNIENIFPKYDIIIKTNSSTVLNLKKVYEFCHSNEFKKDVFYCALCVKTRKYIKKDLYHQESPESILEVDSYPNGNLYMFSKDILHVISSEFSDMHQYLSGAYEDEFPHYNEDINVWYGVPEDFTIGCVLKRNGISVSELDFILSYEYISKMPDAYEKNPYDVFGISCKMGFNWKIRKIFEFDLVKLVCSFYMNVPIKKTCKIAVCTIVKNENAYLREFVEWHRNLGFDNIILYDDNDVDGEHVEDAINDYIECGYVIKVDVRGYRDIICASYNDCIRRFGKDYDWIAFLDCDEHMHLEKDKTAKDFFSKFDNDVDVVGLNWMLMDDNDLLYYDGRPLEERFTRKVKNEYVQYDNIIENTHIKSILRCNDKNVEHAWFDNPHCIKNIGKCVDADGECIKTNYPFTQKVKHDVAYLKHFNTKTIDEFLNNKMMKWKYDAIFDIDFFFRVNEKTEEKQKIINDFIEKENESIQTFRRNKRF